MNAGLDKLLCRLALALVLLGFTAGCATGPEPKPDDGAADQEADGGSADQASPDDAAEVLPPVDAAPGEKLGAVDEAGTAGDGQSNKPPAPDELALSQEASDLLAAAVRTADADPVAALRLVEQAAAKNPKCVQCFYNQGVLFERQGKKAEAISAYRRALKIQSGHLPSVINLSNLYLRDQQAAQARSLVTRAVKASPKDLGLRIQLTSVLLAADMVDDAMEQAKGVLRMDERNAQAMIYLAQAYALKGKYELAERILLKAKKIDKTDAVIPNRLGFVYLEQQNLSAAIESFKAAIALDPELAEGYNNLGVLYNRAKDYRAATEQFRMAVAKAPFFIEAYLNLGNALRGDQQFKEAEAAYRKVLALRPDESRAIFNLGLLYLDDEMPGLMKSERYGKAAEMLQKYRQAGGRHPELAAYIEEAQKKQERAKKTEERQRKREAEKKRQEEEARQKAEEEARQQAAEAARQKAAEAAQQKAAEAAQQKAAEAAQQKAAEAARQKAAEAARQKAAEAARQKAAEEARKKAQEAAPSGGKLGGAKDDEGTAPAVDGDGKLGEDEK